MVLPFFLLLVLSFSSLASSTEQNDTHIGSIPGYSGIPANEDVAKSSWPRSRQHALPQSTLGFTLPVPT